MRGIPLLAALTDRRLRAVWDASVSRGYVPRQSIRKVGDPATHLVLLLRGRVSATTTTATGRVVRFGEFAAPCALDKMAVIDGGGHTATLTALTSCSARLLPRASFEVLVDRSRSVRRHVLGVLADQVRRQQTRFVAAATLHTEARLASWLLEQAAAASNVRVRLPGTQEALADVLGVTRVPLNRALMRLRRDGLIAVEGNQIRLLAPELIRLRASG